MSQARIMIDTIRFVVRPDDYEITGMDEAREKFASLPKDAGVVVITAHVGSWDLAGYGAGKALGRPFHALAKPSKSKWLTPVLGEIRERLSMRVIWTDSKSLLKDMMAVTQRGEALGFVMDQKPLKRQSGHGCTFLGVPGTHIVPGPGLMITRKNLPAYGVYMLRTGRGKFRFYVNEILPQGHGETDELKVAQLLADDMSRMIKLYPEQWSWNYRRWK
jgi:KDO2-lipid IV(A) lauroyltransferase